jgi:hypothetical protein
VSVTEKREGIFTMKLRRASKLRGGLLVLALGGGLVVADATTARADSPSLGSYETIATGLHNPRQMSVGPDGSLYVAEAGTGPVGAAQPGTCTKGEEGESCAGDTASITVIENPAGEPYTFRWVKGLLSVADHLGDGAVGLNAVSVTRTGQVYGIVSGGDPATLPASVLDQNGQLLRFRLDGSYVPVAGISAHALDNPLPGLDRPDSNPYGVLALRGKILVADAGANRVFTVRDGEVETFATFEFRPQDDIDGVPTSIAYHDGKIYVGQLGSLEPGRAKITIYDLEGDVLDTITGLSSVTGVAVAPNGDIYAAEIFTGPPGPDTKGALVKIPADGSERTTVELDAPGGVAVDRAGNVYVTVNSVSGSDGKVIRFSGGHSESPLGDKVSYHSYDGSSPDGDAAYHDHTYD